MKMKQIERDTNRATNLIHRTYQTGIRIKGAMHIEILIFLKKFLFRRVSHILFLSLPVPPFPLQGKGSSRYSRGLSKGRGPLDGEGDWGKTTSCGLM